MAAWARKGPPVLREWGKREQPQRGPANRGDGAFCLNPLLQHLRPAPARLGREKPGERGPGRGAHAGARSRASAPAQETWLKLVASAGRRPGGARRGRGPEPARRAAPHRGSAALHARRSPGARVGRCPWRSSERAEPAWPGGLRDAAPRRAGRISPEAQRPQACSSLQPPSRTGSGRGRPARQVLGRQTSSPPRAPSRSGWGGFPPASPAASQEDRPALLYLYL